ncbi:hypothetical protein F4779DRAFT_596571 [Xylariaceae sp. FL0662B]|nr:hypothetical protein F4779DRAFT_596571 [Xylariaceae sp. FL0662B]
MEGCQQFTPRQRSRSVVRAPFCPPSRPRSRSVDTTTFQINKLHKLLQDLQKELKATCAYIKNGALHFRRVRENKEVRGFLDTLREYEQQQLYLSFLPRQHLLPEDYAALISALEQVRPILAGAGWRIRRYVRLLSILRRRPKSGCNLWNYDLKKLIDVGQEKEEIAVHEFAVAMAPRLEPLVGRLSTEARWLEGLVRELQQRHDTLVEGWRRPSSSRGLPPHTLQPVSRFRRTSAWLRNIISASLSSHQEEHPQELHLMSGPHSPSGHRSPNSFISKTRAWKQDLSMRLESPLIPSDHGDLATKAFQLRFRGLRFWGEHTLLDTPTETKARQKAWLRLKKDIDNSRGPPSTDLIILRMQVETEILLAERQSRNKVQGLGTESGSGDWKGDQGDDGCITGDGDTVGVRRDEKRDGTERNGKDLC